MLFTSFWLVEQGKSQNKLSHPCRKRTLPNKKSTSKKKVNNRIHIDCALTYIASPLRKWIHLTIYPNIDKYLWNHLVTFQLDPTVEFEVMLNSVKLDGRNFYVKIRIWLCLDRITRINRIGWRHGVGCSSINLFQFFRETIKGEYLTNSHNKVQQRSFY
jgi:hypothetical protein